MSIESLERRKIQSQSGIPEGESKGEGKGESKGEGKG